MTYNSGTATDYLDMLDQLVEVITGRHLDTLAVNAGGTLHAAGDVIDITATGATSTEVAKIEVVTVDGGGAILTARIYRGGVYTVDPTTTTGNAQSATTGSGTGATFDLTFDATGWTQLTRQSEAVAAAPTITAGGTGYTNGSTDVLTVVGGVLAPGGSAATYTATVVGGIVTSAALLTAGDYEVVPDNAALTAVAPSGGTGCTLTITWQDTTGDTVVVLQGDAGASIDPLVGIKTYTEVNGDQTGAHDLFNWALFGMTSWSSSAALQDQANISDGLDGSGGITASVTADGAFIPLKDSDAFNIDWWIRANGRNVTMVFKVSTATTDYYAQGSFGLLNQFGISTELPFPAFVAGSSDRPAVWYGDTGSIWGGLSEMISRGNGPCFVWAAEGAWIQMRSAVLSSNTDLTPAEAANTAPKTSVWPLSAAPIHTTADDRIWGIAGTNQFDNSDLTISTGATIIKRTPDTGGDLFPLYPVTFEQNDSVSGFFRTFGELDGVWWLHDGQAGISSEDRITQGGNAYTIFQNGTRNQAWSFLALRED